ncbi:ankyrin repeat protein [Phlyctema vagabunda]|uniref:phospholipase A2 n=1 Tax=Phlyctema vagabunda TaxID=108571 RepID=A0ABR4PEF2_9HELO
MLGRLRMSVAECIDTYIQLSTKVFQKKKHRVTMRGNIQGRFDSTELEQVVKEIIREQGLNDNTLLKDVPGSTCKVFVCATSKETSETVCLTSYKSERGTTDLLNSVQIWEACRATSAASSFFDPIAIGRFKEEFIDGALGANNPVAELWDQAQLIWGSEKLDGRVKCLVSIGTGLPSLNPFPNDVLHIGKALIAIATETEQTAERFRRDKAYMDSNNRYFRFNVIRGLEDIGLEEATKSKEIAAATRQYVASQEMYKQIRACADSLRGQKDTQCSNSSSIETAAFNPFLMSYPDIVTAARDGDEALVKELLQKGVNVNAKGPDNLPALWWAAYKGYPDVLKLLLETGRAIPNFQDGYLKTPLYWARQNGNDACVELLLQTGKFN